MKEGEERRVTIGLGTQGYHSQDKGQHLKHDYKQNKKPTNRPKNTQTRNTADTKKKTVKKNQEYQRLPSQNHKPPRLAARQQPQTDIRGQYVITPLKLAKKDKYSKNEVYRQKVLNLVNFKL